LQRVKMLIPDKIILAVDLHRQTGRHLVQRAMAL